MLKVARGPAKVARGPEKVVRKTAMENNLLELPMITIGNLILFTIGIPSII